MDTLFANILTVSFQASIVALAVIMAKKLFINKINLRISYLLWSLVLIRLLVPVLPPSPASVFNLAGNMAGYAAGIEKATGTAEANQGITAPEPSDAVHPDAPSFSMPPDAGSPGNTDGNTSASLVLPSHPSTEPVVPGKPFPPGILTILSYLWAAGAILTAGYHIYANAAFAAGIKKLKPLTLSGDLMAKLALKLKIKRPPQLLESPHIPSPCVFGVIRCKIILPKGLAGSLDESTLSYILLHELAHIKRRDLLFIWLSSLLCSLHWFNPVLWYCAAMMKREQELCADACVLSMSDENGIPEYGRMLLAMARNAVSRRRGLASAGITENKQDLKERIKNIALFTNKKYRITFFGLLLVLLAGIFLCTSQVDYPETVEEKQKFNDNIMIELSLNSASPGSVELRVHNRNSLAIHGCELAVSDGNAGKPENRIFEEKNFRIGAGKFKSFHISNIDFDKTYLSLSYRYGFSLDRRVNSMGMSGHVAALDRTADVNGWAAVTEEEAESFIKANNLEPIAMNKVYNLLTIIMFENGDTTGYYELYKDTKSDTVRSRWLKGVTANSGKPPVLRMGGTASGTFPFACIRINDPELAAKGAKMEFSTNYGVKTMHLWGAAAYAVETRGYGSIGRIVIYDRAGNPLYDSEKYEAGIWDPSEEEAMDETAASTMAQKLCEDMANSWLKLERADMSDYLVDNLDTHLVLNWIDFDIADRRKNTWRQLKSIDGVELSRGKFTKESEKKAIYQAFADIKYTRYDPGVIGIGIDLTLVLEKLEGKWMITGANTVGASIYSEWKKKGYSTIEEMDKAFLQSRKEHGI